MLDHHMTRSRIGGIDDFPTGSMKSIEVDGRTYAVANVEGIFYAVQGLCPHSNGMLGDGRLEGTIMKCPEHGAEFDVRTGKNIRKPRLPFARATDDLATFKITIEGNDVFLEAL